jgi:hypothetical protein
VFTALKTRVGRAVFGTATFVLVFWEVPWVKRIIAAVTGFDFLYEKSDWWAKAARMALNPPPGTALLVGIVGLVLIYWSTKPRETKMSIPVLGMLISVIAFAGFGVWYLVKNQTDEPHISQLPPASSSPTSAITVVQWNKIFGTSRSVDLVFALFLDGRGPDSKSVKLNNAFLQSGITGEIITMKVGSENPTVDTFPISEANPIPRKGFIRLVATMNPLNPNQGLPNKKFLDNWRQVWFHAFYEDGSHDDILFDETIMESYFPELSGPHVTRMSSASDDTNVPAPQTNALKPPYTTRTVRELRALYEGRTRLQADAFMADEKGKLIETEGTVVNVDNGMAFLQIGQMPQSGNTDHVECRFGPQWTAKLGTFRQGERMKIRGVIGPSQNGAQIYLQDCEIIS